MPKIWYSSANGHPGCFHVLATASSAAMNTGVHVSLSILVSSVCMPWDNPEGWDVRRVWDGRKHIQPWLIHANVWQKPPQYCKVISLQLK